MISTKSVSLKYLAFSLILFAVSLSACTASRTSLEASSGIGGDIAQPEINPPQGYQYSISPHESAGLKPEGELSSLELEKLADAYFINGDLNLAFTNYEKCLQIYPRNQRVHYKKGMLFLIRQLYEDAIECFTLAAKIKPDYAPAYEGLGQALFFIKEYEDAEKNLQKAARLNPELWRCHNFLGIIYDYQGKYSSAVHEYSAAIAIKPNEGHLYNNLGISFCLLGKHEEAIEAFGKALQKGYREEKVYNNLGLSLGRLERYDEAFETFKRGANRAKAYNNLGFIYLNHGKYKEAMECFEKSIALSPSFYDKARENLEVAKRGLSETR